MRDLLHNLFPNTWALQVLDCTCSLRGKNSKEKEKGKRNERKRRLQERQKGYSILQSHSGLFWTVCSCFCTNSAYLLLLAGRERAASLHPEEAGGGNYPGLSWNCSQQNCVPVSSSSCEPSVAIPDFVYLEWIDSSEGWVHGKAEKKISRLPSRSGPSGSDGKGGSWLLLTAIITSHTAIRQWQVIS